MRLEFRLAESGKSFGAEKNGVVRLSAGNGLLHDEKGGGKRCKREVRRAFFDLGQKRGTFCNIYAIKHIFY